MKAIVREEYGSPDVLELRDIDIPVAKDDEVLVRVRAASLNQADLDYLYGKPLLTKMGTGLRGPKNRGLGLDVAGRVEAVGKDVTALQPRHEPGVCSVRERWASWVSSCSRPELCRRSRGPRSLISSRPLARPPGIRPH